MWAATKVAFIKLSIWLNNPPICSTLQNVLARYRCGIIRNVIIKRPTVISYNIRIIVLRKENQILHCTSFGCSNLGISRINRPYSLTICIARRVQKSICSKHIERSSIGISNIADFIYSLHSQLDRTRHISSSHHLEIGIPIRLH